MVTFRDGKPYKAGYRKFRMKTVAGTDDYASLAETVSRRAAEYEKYSGMAANGEPSSNYFGQKPDLLLMDGGRGQVGAAKAALAGTALADVPLYGMVKDDHHRTRAIVDSEGREIAINMNRGTFTFITAIQDETHRFANAYRKQQMNKKSYSSTLTEVPGVGPKTAKALMAQFKSVGAVKRGDPRPAGEHPRRGAADGPDHLRIFPPAGGEASGKVRRRPVCDRAFCREGVFMYQFQYDIRPGRYRHFKGNEYQVLGMARHSETEEEMVVYRPLYGEGGLWVRPAAMWAEVVERDGRRQPRFAYIGE